MDLDLVGSESCSPPCWKGIVPGETSENQAIEILRRMESEKIGKLTLLPDVISWQDVENRNYTIEVEEGLVVQISFIAETTNLREIIDKFGIPDGFAAVAGRHGKHSIILYYPSEGLSFFAVDKRWGRLHPGVKIFPSMPITFVHFIAPTDLPSMLAVIHGEDWEGRILSEMNEWDGYGTIDP
jgi:hypothetical protein